MEAIVNKINKNLCTSFNANECKSDIDVADVGVARESLIDEFNLIAEKMNVTPHDPKFKASMRFSYYVHNEMFQIFKALKENPLASANSCNLKHATDAGLKVLFNDLTGKTLNTWSDDLTVGLVGCFVEFCRAVVNNNHEQVESLTPKILEKVEVVTAAYAENM